MSTTQQCGEPLARITRWLPYAVLPSTHEEGRLRPELVELRPPVDQADWIAAIRDGTMLTINTWPIDVVMSAFADHALAWHTEAARWSKVRTRTTVDELKQWVTYTGGLADRVPFSGLSVDLMRQAAARVERILRSPEPFFVNWPRFGTKADADRRASVHLWAIERLLRAVNETEAEYAAVRAVEPGNIPPTKIWPALFEGHADVDPAFATYKSARNRVDYVDTLIKPQAHDPLMVTVIHGLNLPQHSATSPYPATPPK